MFILWYHSNRAVYCIVIQVEEAHVICQGVHNGDLEVYSYDFHVHCGGKMFGLFKIYKSCTVIESVPENVIKTTTV